MGDSFKYRNAIPHEMSSSSPLHNMIALSSSPPLSPQSPTLARSNANINTSSRPSAFLQSPVSSNNNDPFAGNSKASLSSHPSFGKDQLRSKHIRGSPQKAAQAGFKTWVLPSANATSRIDDNHRLAIDETLEQHFFDSSDDNPSSDWSNPASTAASSMQTTIPSYGLGIEASSSQDQYHSLGLGEAFQEPGSPSFGRKARVRTFSRTQSSSKDPFSGNGGSSSFPNVEASPRFHQRQSQKRRLTGSSPKKLSRSSQNSQFNNISSDESSDEGLAPWEQMISERTSGVNWSSVVEQVFEKVDGSIDLW